MEGLYKLNNLKELTDEIDIGMDIEFCIGKQRYNISWRNDKPFICLCPDGEALFYADSKDMMENYLVNGTPLKDLWEDIGIISM